MFKKYLLAASLAMVALMPAMSASAAEPKLSQMEFELPQLNIQFGLSPFYLVYGGEIGFGYYFDKMNGLHIGAAPNMQATGFALAIPVSYRARFGLTDKLSAYVGAGPSVNLMFAGGMMATAFGGRLETGLRYHLNDSWMLGGGLDFSGHAFAGQFMAQPGLKLMAAMSM